MFYFLCAKTIVLYADNIKILIYIFFYERFIFNSSWIYIFKSLDFVTLLIIFCNFVTSIFIFFAVSRKFSTLSPNVALSLFSILHSQTPVRNALVFHSTPYISSFLFHISHLFLQLLDTFLRSIFKFINTLFLCS